MTKKETIPSVEGQKTREQLIKDAMGVYGD